MKQFLEEGMDIVKIEDVFLDFQKLSIDDDQQIEINIQLRNDAINRIFDNMIYIHSDAVRDGVIQKIANMIINEGSQDEKGHCIHILRTAYYQEKGNYFKDNSDNVYSIRKFTIVYYKTFFIYDVINSRYRKDKKCIVLCNI